MNSYLPIESAAAISLPLAEVGLAVVVLLGEQTGSQHTPHAAEHVHRGRVHHIVDLHYGRQKVAGRW